MCDTVPPGFEGEVPSKFLAKSTLFRFPIKGFIEFFGGLPVTRPEDDKAISREERLVQNRSTMQAAIDALEKGWPVTIFPEGTSITVPGLILPLKTGVAKLAFAAEEANGFRMGLKVIPVGLEYGSRRRIGSGLTIRYGKVLRVSEYRELYEQNKEEGIRKLMEDITRELILNYPHFRDEKTQTLGRKLVALGLVRSRYQAAQLFLRREDDKAFWAALELRLRAFEAANKERGIPLPAWGHRRVWKELGPERRRIRGIFLLLGAPFAILDLLNSSVPEYFLSTLVNYISVDDTELMSLRFMLSPPVLLPAYGLQFWLLQKFFFPGFGGWGLYFLYAVASFMLWYFGVRWRQQFKRIMSLLFFRFAGVDGRSEAVAYYHALRKDLGDFEDHGRKRSEHR